MARARATSVAARDSDDSASDIEFNCVLKPGRFEAGPPAPVDFQRFFTNARKNKSNHIVRL
jgi:hypothetical protein